MSCPPPRHRHPGRRRRRRVVACGTWHRSGHCERAQDASRTVRTRALYLWAIVAGLGLRAWICWPGFELVVVAGIDAAVVAAAVASAAVLGAWASPG